MYLKGYKSTNAYQNHKALHYIATLPWYNLAEIKGKNTQIDCFQKQPENKACLTYEAVS